MVQFKFAGLILTSILLVIVLLLQYELWFAPDGLQDMVKYKNLLKQQRIENLDLKKQNEELIAKIKNLKENPEAAEAKARDELGLIKKGEVFYQIGK